MSEKAQQKERAEAIKDMLGTRGWEIVEEELLARSKEVTSELLDAIDINDIHRLQAEAKALREFFDTITGYASIKT